jgi:hypothetical protein
MTRATRNIKYFIQLLKEQPHLFSETDLANLQAIQFSTDLKPLSQFISAWCEDKSRSQILNAMEAAHNKTSQANWDRPAGGPSDDDDDDDDETYTDYRGQILNAILNRTSQVSQTLSQPDNEQQPSQP